MPKYNQVTVYPFEDRYDLEGVESFFNKLMARDDLFTSDESFRLDFINGVNRFPEMDGVFRVYEDFNGPTNDVGVVVRSGTNLFCMWYVDDCGFCCDFWVECGDDVAQLAAVVGVAFKHLSVYVVELLLGDVRIICHTTGLYHLTVNQIASLKASMSVECAIVEMTQLHVNDIDPSILTHEPGWQREYIEAVQQINELRQQEYRIRAEVELLRNKCATHYEAAIAGLYQRS